MLDYDQWVVLEKIEITLKKIAMWQRILEGEKYPTGLLVVSAIHAIRVHYVDVLNSPHAQEPVKRLTKTLLEDFDKHYHPPAGNVGKEKFTCRPETRVRNCLRLLRVCMALKTLQCCGNASLPEQRRALRGVYTLNPPKTISAILGGCCPSIRSISVEHKASCGALGGHFCRGRPWLWQL